MLTTAVEPVTIVGSPMLTRQPLRSRPEHAGLVDELERRGHGPLREIDRDVRQTDADEADPLPLERPRGRHDHHLGRAERGFAHGMSSIEVNTVFPQAAGDIDHAVRPFGRAADAQHGVAARQYPFGDRMEDLVERVATGALALRLFDER